MKNQGFYFIDKGEIELFIYLDDENYQNALPFATLKVKRFNINFSLKVFKPGETFGISQFLIETAEKFSAKSLSVSHLLFLEREDMISTLREFPEDLVIKS